LRLIAAAAVQVETCVAGKIEPHIQVWIGPYHALAWDFDCRRTRGKCRPSRRCSGSRSVGTLSLQRRGHSRTRAIGSRGHRHCGNRRYHFECHELPLVFHPDL